MAKTLSELKGTDDTKAKPYPTGIIKVRIAKVGHTASFTGSGGEPGQILNFSVADPKDAALATLNDSTKFGLIKEGKSIIIKNFMAKNGRIILTKHSKIMTGPLVDVPEDVSAKATFIICPPSPVKNIKDVKEMPRRSLVTIRGQIVKDECMKEVKVGNDPTNIHTIRICQDGEEIDISLWRDAAETKVNVGDYIEVTQCVTGEWNRAIVANTTRNTKVKLVEAPEVEMIVTVEGLSMEDLEEHVDLIVSEKETFKDLKIGKDLLLDVLNVKNDDNCEEMLSEMLPFKALLKVKNLIIYSIKVLSEEDEEERGD